MTRDEAEDLRAAFRRLAGLEFVLFDSGAPLDKASVEALRAEEPPYRTLHRAEQALMTLVMEALK